MEEALSLRQRGGSVSILFFAHHPLIFSPLTSVQKGDPVGEMVRRQHGLTASASTVPTLTSTRYTMALGRCIGPTARPWSVQNP